MGLRNSLRSILPADTARLYAWFAHRDEMALYRKLRTTEPADPMEVSFQPFVAQEAIFFHIPKTAGISVAQGLFGCRAGRHMLLYEYKRAFSAREFQRFYKFTFVRNPWDRLVSAYHYMSDGGMNALDVKQAELTSARFPDFTSFVQSYMTNEPFEDKLHLRSQWRYICADAYSAPELDFVGRFERLPQDYAVIARQLGRPEALPHRNAGKSRGRKDYRSFYTDHTAEIVARCYARDIALFDYEFDPAPDDAVQERQA